MAKQTRSDDWGFPRWRPYGAKGRAAARSAPVRPRGLQRAGRPARAQGAQQPRALDFCEAHAAEYNKNWNYFAGLTAEEAARARRRGRERRLGLPHSPRISNGAGRATAAAAATRCARSTRSSSTPTPISRRSRPPIAAWPRNIIPTSTGRQGSRQALPAGPGGLRRAAQGRRAEDRQAQL